MLETLQCLITGLTQILNLTTFGLMLLGIAIGFAVGILPGLGGPTAMALMLPFVVKMTPVEAFAFLLGMACVVNTTGDITSILFGIPGDLQYPANVFHGPSRYSIVKKTADEWQSHGQVLTHYLTGAIKPEDFSDGVLPLVKIHEGFAAIRRKEATKLTVNMPH